MSYTKIIKVNKQEYKSQCDLYSCGYEVHKSVIVAVLFIFRALFLFQYVGLLALQMPVSLRGAIPAGEVDGIVPLLCTDPEAEDVSTAVQPHPSLSFHY